MFLPGLLQCFFSLIIFNVYCITGLLKYFYLNLFNVLVWSSSVYLSGLFQCFLFGILHCFYLAFFSVLLTFFRVSVRTFPVFLPGLIQCFFLIFISVSLAGLIQGFNLVVFRVSAQTSSVFLVWTCFYLPFFSVSFWSSSGCLPRRLQCFFWSSSVCVTELLHYFTWTSSVFLFWSSSVCLPRLLQWFFLVFFVFYLDFYSVSFWCSFLCHNWTSSVFLSGFLHVFNCFTWFMSSFSVISWTT